MIQRSKWSMYGLYIWSKVIEVLFVSRIFWFTQQLRKYYGLHFQNVDKPLTAKYRITN